MTGDTFAACVGHFVFSTALHMLIVRAVKRIIIPPTLMQWCCGAVVYWCCGVWCSGVLVQWCIGAVVQWCIGAVVYWCNGVLVQWREFPTVNKNNPVSNVLPPVLGQLFSHYIAPALTAV